MFFILRALVEFGGTLQLDLSKAQWLQALDPSQGYNGIEKYDTPSPIPLAVLLWRLSITEVLECLDVSDR